MSRLVFSDSVLSTRTIPEDPVAAFTHRPRRQHLRFPAGKSTECTGNREWNEEALEWRSAGEDAISGDEKALRVEEDEVKSSVFWDLV